VTLKKTPVKFARNALAGLGLFVVLVTVFPVDSAILRLISTEWDGRPGRVLIVLGADSLPDMIGLSTYWRSVYAVRMWREGGFERVLLSGGKNAAGATVADQMRQFLVSQGVPPERIDVEGESRDTHENAIYTKRMLGPQPGPSVLLTSDYHMFRAVRVFRKAGLDVHPRPIPDAAKLMGHWRLRWSLFVDLAIENSKTLYYFVRGWI